MMNRFLFWLSGFLPVRFIRPGDRDYIERYWIGRVKLPRGKRVTFYLHRYTGSDRDRYLHDHPWWWAIGIPLCGGYWEERFRYFAPRDGIVSVWRYVGRFRFNLLLAGTLHRIHEVKPGTWTLFIHSAKADEGNPFIDSEKGWGFLKQIGFTAETETQYQNLFQFVQYKDYLNSKGWEKNAPRGKDSVRVPLHG